MNSFINFKNCNYTPHPESPASRPTVTKSPLTQQSSKYALTFDELQNTFGGSGKNLGSMNMDKLLKNIWTSEETQAMTPISNFGTANNGNLQKQGSLTLPRTLSQKTVDEVWRELHKDVNLIKEPNLQPQEKQPTLAEMTLEDFLHKAGVVGENNQTQTIGRLFGDECSLVFGLKNPNQNQAFHKRPFVTESKNEVKLQKITPKQAAFNFTSSINVMKNPQTVSSENGVSIIGKKDNSMKSILRPKSPSDLFQNSTLDMSPSPPSYAYGEDGVHESNRGGTLERVVERRRKRMIKNRESAARSRARKQAYTLELEAEVAKLKELNQELQKKLEEIMESQNFQVPEKVKFRGNRRLCLRRTLTGPW